MLAARIRLMITVLWAGSLWTIGYLVAPTLFATLPDRALAGTIAGNLFNVEAWLTIVCSVVLGAMSWHAGETGQPADRQARRVLLTLIGAMLVCTLVSHFGLQPVMATLREQAVASGSGLGVEFGLLHGGTSLIYLVQSILAGYLLLKLR